MLVTVGVFIANLPITDARHIYGNVGLGQERRSGPSRAFFRFRCR